jgi:hypothetical protein
MLKWIDPMKPMFVLLLGVAGLGAIASTSAAAGGGTHWDAVCNCRRPDSEYKTRRFVHESPRVRIHKRVVNQTKVVRGKTRLVQENRLIVHVRPMIDREVVLHRTNTIVKDVLQYRVNTYVIEPPEVRSVNCGCGYQHRGLLTSFHEENFQ